ncbi:MAG: bifunctional DNA-binding transcriptional regulator/O6-methylguanine-DNA methyltransferase Ada [Alphaproteobacteria bacterium]|nr:bifunctional DNA-binding transcriptional regulator/O6-methylguanine-DNA methyltransferase Ada [Alphaproteobacteria bacterium]
MRRHVGAMSTIEDSRWDLVCRRQAAEFLYAVTTMGIYCRPGCPSPRPKREHVRFFPTPDQAEAAGFRACRRCDPKGERAALGRAVVEAACAQIEASETIPSLEALAQRAGYSRFHFLRMFRDHTGLTPRSYAEGVRARRLQAALATGERVADAVVGSGFGSESRVYEDPAKLLGMTPGAARRGGAGETIRTALADSPFGRLLVGATERGVCYIGFAEPDDALLGDLRARFPRAHLVTDDAGLAAAVRAVVDFMEEPRAGIALPVDLRGTAFQVRVWRALQTVPPGQTRSYSGIAAAIGAPRAVRAVARACASNKVSLAVPCHRIVGSDGALTGYRWGLARKRTLLERERG